MVRSPGHIIVFLLLAQCVAAKQIIVCPGCPIVSVNEAIKVAQHGDEILIRSGTYEEYGIVIDKQIKISGEKGTVVDGLNKGEIFTVIADHVEISNLTIQNVGTSYTEDRAGIRIRKSRNFKITSNRLINTFFGIYLEHSSYGKVAGNFVEGEAEEEMSSGNAIHAWYCNQIEITDNEVRNHRDGIYFEFVDSSYIKGNLSEENLRYGLHFMFSNDDNYFQNVFRDNGAGVAVMFSKNINMWDNQFIMNWGKSSYGLLLKEIYDAEIVNNRFQENTIGIYVEGSTRINYRNNDFVQNGWAIKISGGCLDNAISQNNFISNTFDLSVRNNKNKNLFDGNYWSSYTGYDLDKDGIGDVAYRPVKLFNYIVDTSPESMVLMRSLFVDLVNFSEKVSPIFTPKNVIDAKPHIRPFKRKAI